MEQLVLVWVLPVAYWVAMQTVILIFLGALTVLEEAGAQRHYIMYALTMESAFLLLV